ncbi:hypothetical protein [Bradyrhizobium sp. USDA 4473]
MIVSSSRFIPPFSGRQALLLLVGSRLLDQAAATTIVSKGGDHEMKADLLHHDHGRYGSALAFRAPDKVHPETF